MVHQNRDVAAYYERNTRRFLRWGEGGRAGALHRSLWAPGVRSVEEAADRVNLLLAEELSSAPRPDGAGHIVDLGCGVGGTAVRLAELLSANVTGLTLSGLQVKLATERAEARGLSDRCRFLQADFLDPPALAPAHGVVAVESLAHVPDPAGFFQTAREALVPGGKLVVVDDTLEAQGAGDPARERALDRFRRGWRVPSVLAPEALIELAEVAGLAHDHTRDLTPMLRLGRPRDRAIAVLVAAFGWARPLERLAGWGNLFGGDALQTCLARGWIRYRLMTWSKL